MNGQVRAIRTGEGRMKSFAAAGAVLALFSLQGCASNQKFVEHKLNSGIGKPVHDNTWFVVNPHVKRVEIGPNIEFTFRGEDRCSFTYVVDKESQIIKAWRYEGDPTPCWYNYATY